MVKYDIKQVRQVTKGILSITSNNLVNTQLNVDVQIENKYYEQESIKKLMLL